jgi:Family of unknown function (DUF6488)
MKFTLINAGVLTAVAAVIFSATPARAGEDGACHFHGNRPASEKVVLACATQRVESLVSTKKIEPSWKGIQHERIELVDGKKSKEWKVTFRNSNAKEKSKEVLFMFYTPAGNFIAANFTGQ